MKRLRVLAVWTAAALSSACQYLPPLGEPAPASGRVKSDTRETFYDVEGQDADELFAQMRAKGLRVSRLVLFGDYRWDLSWKVRYDSSWAGGSCRMTDVQVLLKGEAILPQWQPPAAADAELRGHWNRFVEGLRAHEKGHADIAARAAQEIKSALQKHTRNDCKGMQRGADKLANALLKQHREVDARYDHESRYGASQGANWPPPRAAAPERSLFGSGS